jgi:DNA-binding response OmpR family regulator
VVKKRETSGRRPASETRILVVDDNRDLLHFIDRLLLDTGWAVTIAESAKEAKRALGTQKLDAALFDYTLPDGNGVKLGVQFAKAFPGLLVIIMTGVILPPEEEEALCEEHNFPVLRKPFLARDVIEKVRARLRPGKRQLVRPAKAKTASEVPTTRALKVFFCYSHHDERMCDRLDAQLSTLRRMGIIHSWHDKKIMAGSEWEEAIDQYLTSADLILLLISPDFINSDYCYRKEMGTALKRHSRGEARVIPVILRPADWESTPFSKLQVVPKDGKPISLWRNRDDGYLNAALAIRSVAEELSATIRRA